MQIAAWSRALGLSEPLGSLLEDEDASREWRSVAYEARPVLVAAAYLKHPRKMLVVTATHERALQWQAKLALCGVPDAYLAQLPSGISALFEDATPEHSALSDRIGALRSLVEEDPTIVIATPSAALERTLPAEVLQEAFLTLRPGDTADPVDLVRRLNTLGYEPQDPVRLPGQYCRRGGILDIYASGLDLPVRIELFGDEIESLRSFDPNTQRSVGTIPALGLAPSRETLHPEDPPQFRELLLDSMEREAAHLPDVAAARLRELIEGDANALENHLYFDRLDLYRPLLHPDSGCAIDLLGDEGLLVLDEPLELETLAARSEEDLADALRARGERGELLQSTANDFMLPTEHLGGAEHVWTLSAMNALPDWLTLPSNVDIGAASLEPYRGRAEAFATTLQTWREQGFTLLFCTDQPTRARSVLSQVELFPAEEGEPEFAGGAYLAAGNLAGGFVLPEQKIAFISDAELFGVARLKLPQKRFSEGAPIATVLDLKAGDYVVHISFGIGVFRGLVKRSIEGVEREYLHLDYAPPDKLFVPADQLDRVQKYLNPGDTAPKLNRLTGGEWQKTLSKAREDARAYASDLVRLYAKRKEATRRPFGPDSPWQGELEATFPWVETPSQLQAIVETKRDLTEPYPMDRLVCGDVGFGKTEVAIRAAFKVVQEGKQVAVLCPTTILSEQHFRNFDERLSPFGTRIALLNRFRTTGERNQIVKELEAGKIDLVIGTHALLAKEMRFKDLGLVVIDEEQKFGVKHKENLKELRTEVDVLTLTATPIPRTLSMALMDIRQMSLINDPPPGRLPIRTHVRPYSPEVVREAMLRELARGGQVYYVYNRVESIAHVAERLRRLVPHARIGIGHGQMTEKQLEPVMIGFIHGEIDVLLSTTIIENGIDIPNANTLIVENADRLGLAQLYQLRGRVGRSDRQAYAYLLYQSGKELTDGAMQRLQALQEFSSLGSGYSLAFRDLQIRGAGELLGAKQHGAMAAVGYELYSQLINEAVQMLKNSVDGKPPGTGDEPKDPLESLAPLPSFDVPVHALIPDTFIRDQAQRLYYYQKMMGSRDRASLAEVRAEIEDRYGHLPESADAAFGIMSLRMTARDLGIDKLEAKGGRIAIGFRDKSAVPPRVFSILGRRNRECYVTREGFIWPTTGDPMLAVTQMLDAFEAAHAQLEAERAQLEV
ncbi:MAG: transcription-repair coupling factor [Chthonomonadaceae bacterium]|nr:transcription-repair coupling factor [Chthonomonadaceae bacterium]